MVPQRLTNSGHSDWWTGFPRAAALLLRHRGRLPNRGASATIPDTLRALDMAEGGGDVDADGGVPAVFISYASQDAAVADAVVAALERTGIKCWIAPRDVVPGEFYAGAIVHAIDATRAMVLVLSGNAAGSPHVLREVERASSRRHPVVSFRVDLAPMPADLEYFLNSSHWLDASATGVDGALPKLVDAVKRAVLPASHGDPRAAMGAEGSGMPPAPRPTTAAASSPRPIRKVVALVAIMAIGLAYFRFEQLRPAKHAPQETPVAAAAHVEADSVPVTPAISERSVAVLPFVDMSERKDQEYFSDGLSEELIDLLTKVADLRVPARTSSFYFKGKQAKVPDIARELRVAHVLEGSVRKSGNHLRITAELVRADSGYHVWSQTYDRTYNDIFKVQDEIAAAVVEALKVSLLATSMPKATSAANTYAYTLYLKARALLNQFSIQSTEQAATYLKQALGLDAKFAPAWALYAKTRTILYEAGRIDFERARGEARDAAMRAVALDPKLSAAHVSMARVYDFFEWNWAAMDAEIKLARQLDPNDSDALRYAGIISLAYGRANDAVDVLQRAVELDPLEAANYAILGNAYLAAGRLQDSRLAFQHSAALNPLLGGHFGVAEVLLIGGDGAAALTEFELCPEESDRIAGRALALYALGRQAAADAALAELERRFADNGSFSVAMIHAYRGEIDQSFTWLERAYARKDRNLPSIMNEPFAQNLRGDPRYDAMLRKMKLLD